MLCPCILGPANPDQGWCGGALVFDIQQGNSDAVNLGGTKAVFVGEWPHDFLGGNGTGRIYIDEGANPDQRRELEAIFGGKKGGAFAAIGGLMTKMLPTQNIRITVQAGENPSVTIGNIGQLRLQRVKREDGRQTKLEGAPAMRAFGSESSDLARGDGSYFNDPGLRRWVSGGHGGVSAFTLSA